MPLTWPFNQDVFPAEKFAIFASDVKITTCLKETIIYHYHKNALKEYVKHKYHLNNYNMDHIDWASIYTYMHNLKVPQCAMTSKFIHGWLPTQHFLHKQNHEQSPGIWGLLCSHKRR